MAVVMRIDDVPDDAYRQLRAQARAAGQSLSEYLRAHVVRLASARTGATETGTSGAYSMGHVPWETHSGGAAADPSENRETAASPDVPLQLRRRVERDWADGAAQSTD